MSGRPVCLACSIFQAELEGLVAAGALDVEVRILSSMLHMDPEALDRVLDREIRALRASDRPVVLAYGDCCPHMEAWSHEPGVARVPGINCCDIALGAERYRRLRREGVFFVLPHWAERWHSIFERHLGLTEATAAMIMQEVHTRLSYLDFGTQPVPTVTLDAMAAYCGLPWDVLTVDLAGMRGNLEAALLKADRREP